MPKRDPQTQTGPEDGEKPGRRFSRKSYYMCMENSKRRAMRGKNKKSFSCGNRGEGGGVTPRIWGGTSEEGESEEWFAIFKLNEK